MRHPDHRSVMEGSSNPQPVLQPLRGSHSKDGLKLTWICTFAYRWQTCAISLGLACLVTGAIFFLISVGMRTVLWKALGTGFIGVGVLLTVVGGVWCACLVRREKKANPRGFYYTYSRSELENETVTSEATCTVNS